MTSKSKQSDCEGIGKTKSSQPANSEKLNTFLDRCMAAVGVRNAAALAKLLNLSPGAVAMWKQGSLPRKDVLFRISELSGASIHWLITGAGPRYVGEPPAQPPPPSPDAVIAQALEAKIRQVVREVVREEIDLVLQERLRIVAPESPTLAPPSAADAPATGRSGRSARTPKTGTDDSGTSSEY